MLKKINLTILCMSILLFFFLDVKAEKENMINKKTNFLFFQFSTIIKNFMKKIFLLKI